MRQRTDNGDRVDNPSLTQCRDPLVHAAILLLEAYENAAHNEPVSYTHLTLPTSDLV